MDKRKVVLEHREALDALDQAASKKKSCAIKNRCGDKVECLDCPAFKEYQNRKCIFAEKADALKEVNKQVVQQNDTLAQQQVIERKQQRLAKRQQKQNTKATTPIPPNRKVILIPKKEKKERKKEMTVTNNDALSNLTREDLTKERYLQHRDVENLTQMQIAKMYNIPYGSITGFVKKLMADNEVSKVVTQETTGSTELVLLQDKYAELETQYAEITKSHQELQKSFDDLHVSYNKLQQELAASQEMNQMRQDTIIGLEGELEEAKKLNSPVEDAAQSNETVGNYKDLYIDERLRRMQAEDRCIEVEYRYEKLLQTHNNQMSAFREYEVQVLGRLLSEIKG